MCAPPDFADQAARVGVPMVPVGQSARALVHRVKPSAADAPRVAAELVAARFDAVAAPAEGCDVLVATGMPAGEREMADTRHPLRVRVLHSSGAAVAAPFAAAAAGPAVPAGRDGQPRALGRGRRADTDAVRSAAQRPPGVDEHVAVSADHVFTDRPWLAADPTLFWPGSPDLDVVQTGAWYLPGRPPTPGRPGGLPERGRAAGLRELRQRAHPAGRRPGRYRGDPRQGRRAVVARGWADLAAIDDRADCFVVGEVTSRRCSPGWPPSSTTAARAPRRRPPGRRASGGGAPDSRSAVLGRPGGRAGHRRSPRRSDSDRRVPVGRAEEDTGAAETRARATALSAVIRTDGANVAAKRIFSLCSCARPPRMRASRPDR